MQYIYFVSFESVRGHSRRAIRDLVARYPELVLSETGESVRSCDQEDAVRRLYHTAQEQGFRCSFWMVTLYDKEDALCGKLGLLGLGPSNSNQFSAVLPKDAFDFSNACPHCGLGAERVKPHLLSQRSIRCAADFYYGAEGTSIPLMRTEIGQKIMDATGDPNCMRHPVTRAGKVVKE